MPKATINNGDLINLADCYIEIPGYSDQIKFNVLPDISDSKSAAYNDEPIIGRSFPLKTYSHSENRAISMQIHLIVTKKADIYSNLRTLRAIQSATYPKDRDSSAPYLPPPVCKLKCGKLLADDALCVILKSYSVKFPPDVIWDEDTYTPYKFDIDTSWEVVYRNSDLPGQERILGSGR
jgi:hypothetical protein